MTNLLTKILIFVWQTPQICQERGAWREMQSNFRSNWKLFALSLKVLSAPNAVCPYIFIIRSSQPHLTTIVAWFQSRASVVAFRSRPWLARANLCPFVFTFLRIFPRFPFLLALILSSLQIQLNLVKAWPTNTVFAREFLRPAVHASPHFKFSSSPFSCLPRNRLCVRTGDLFAIPLSTLLQKVETSKDEIVFETLQVNYSPPKPFPEVTARGND